jgi:hypothetical protein
MGQEVAQNCATDHFPGAGGTHFLGAKIKINDLFSHDFAFLRRKPENRCSKNVPNWLLFKR